MLGVFNASRMLRNWVLKVLMRRKRNQEEVEVWVEELLDGVEEEILD
jgi:hypothetical protein